MVVCVASVGLPRRQAHMWCLTAGNARLGRVSVRVGGVSWMIGHFGVMSTWRGSGCCLATRCRIYLPGWMVNCVVLGKGGRSRLLAVTVGCVVCLCFLFPFSFFSFCLAFP